MDRMPNGDKHRNPGSIIEGSVLQIFLMALLLSVGCNGAWNQHSHNTRSLMDIHDIFFFAIFGLCFRIFMATTPYRYCSYLTLKGNLLLGATDLSVKQGKIND